jgi:hypothetical protein
MLPVLLLTHSRDYYTIDRVEEGLDRRGFRHLRVDTDTFPSALRLSVRTRGAALHPVLDFGAFALELEDVPAIWARRLWPGAMPATMEPRLAAHCRQAARTALFDTLLGLARPRWVNPLGPLMRAESKLLQLELASRLGLRVPDTLVTNDPREVRTFFHAHGGRVITKLLDPLSQTMEGGDDFVYTSVVEAADLEAIDSVQWAPQIFQPLLTKARELRVIIAGQRCYTGALDVRGCARAELDWRRALSTDGLSWTRDALPPATEAKARALLAELGLVYGALDFIVTPDGDEPVFLEVNPAGEWGWLERDLGYPIGDSLAEALVAGLEAP